MLNILLYIWQLPQNIVGLLFALFLRPSLVMEKCGIKFYASKQMRGGISLGRYVFLSTNIMMQEYIYSHEYGHTLQSLYLGPLYLPVIGICSLLWAALRSTGDYYKYWTERWANRLGGVVIEYVSSGQYDYYKVIDSGIISLNNTAASKLQIKIMK